MDTNKPSTWTDDDAYWRENYKGRPYAAKRDYEFFRPGYRYGFESAQRYRGKQWDDVQRELESGWNTFEHRGKSTWQEVKDAVRDAWNRVFGYDREPAHK
jgi:hypothetical protein